MFQWIDARRGAPWEATCEKSVCGPCKVAGQGPQSESIRHYIDKECLEKIFVQIGCISESRICLNE